MFLISLPRYGFCSSSASLAHVTSKAQAQSSSLTDAARTILSLEDVLDAPLPPCPLEPSLRAHWLAASGVQPLTEENQSAPDAAPAMKAAATTSNAAAVSDVPSAAASNFPAPPPAAALADAAAPKDVSQELFLFFEKVLHPLPFQPPPPPSLRQVSNALVSGPEVVRSTALLAVSRNPGLQPLLPYLVQFISDEVAGQIKNSSRLAVALRLVSALISSPHLHIEPFAHQVT
jgi:transcription initiation factor TFIID subunit 6